MKKVISMIPLLIIILMMFTLCACNESHAETKEAEHIEKEILGNWEIDGYCLKIQSDNTYQLEDVDDEEIIENGKWTWSEEKIVFTSDEGDICQTEIGDRGGTDFIEYDSEIFYRQIKKNQEDNIEFKGGIYYCPGLNAFGTLVVVLELEPLDKKGTTGYVYGMNYVDKEREEIIATWTRENEYLTLYSGDDDIRLKIMGEHLVLTAEDAQTVCVDFSIKKRSHFEGYINEKWFNWVETYDYKATFNSDGTFKYDAYGEKENYRYFYKDNFLYTYNIENDFASVGYYLFEDGIYSEYDTFFHLENYYEDEDSLAPYSIDLE